MARGNLTDPHSKFGEGRPARPCIKHSNAEGRVDSRRGEHPDSCPSFATVLGAETLLLGLALPNCSCAFAQRKIFPPGES